jgi:hypothetical protein
MIRKMMIEGDRLSRLGCMPTSIDWGRLESAMFYFLNNYADYGSWMVIDGTSFNLHPWIFLGWVPIAIDSDRLDNDTPDQLARELLHESMHDWMMYGFGHSEINPILADYDKLRTLLKTTDCIGGSPWNRIIRQLGPAPLEPSGPKTVP